MLEKLGLPGLLNGGDTKELMVKYKETPIPLAIPGGRTACLHLKKIAKA